MSTWSPKQLARDVLADLPTNSSWLDILWAIRKVWVSTAPPVVVARAMEVFEGEKRAVGWLTSPCRALGDRAPLDVAETPEGQEMVLGELVRIEYGVYS